MTTSHILKSFLLAKDNFGENIAVVDPELTLNYSELYSCACALAWKIKEAGVKQGDLVGIYMENSAFSTYSILATLLAGQAYVPLNPEFPKDKLSQIAEQAGPTLILQREKMSFDTDQFETLNVELSSEICDLSLGFTPLENELAYVMFTSGTTGKPKGVPITCKNLINFFEWAMNAFDFKPTDRFSGHSRLSFDLSVFDIFCSLGSGATYYPLPATEIINPGPFIRENELTIWFSVPSIVNSLRSNMEFENGFPSLRYVLFCGESFTVKNAIEVVDNIPEARVHNIYGPTEATIACSSFHVTKSFLDKSPKDIPIGKPFLNVELLIVDPNTLKEKPVGEEGALFILGSQLSPGYWKRDDLTSKAFHIIGGKRAYDTGDLAILDENDEIHWIGRRDLQVKVNGFRIELLEIDHALSEVEELNEIASCVFSRGELKTIQAHFTLNCSVENNILKPRIIKKAREKLSSYMIPSQYFVWEQLPKNANGKIDRKKISLEYRKATRL